jgi:hypothetical protein
LIRPSVPPREGTDLRDGRLNGSKPHLTDSHDEEHVDADEVDRLEALRAQMFGNEHLAGSTRLITVAAADDDIAIDIESLGFGDTDDDMPPGAQDRAR